MTEEEKWRVLEGFVRGTFPRDTAMRMLGLTWYGDLLDAVAAAGLERQPAPKETQREAMEFAYKILKGR